MKGTVKLHLGCFDMVVPGWINTDITPHIWISRVPGFAFFLYKMGVLPTERYEQHKAKVFCSVQYLNVTKKFPYTDDTVDYVFALIFSNTFILIKLNIVSMKFTGF